MKTLFLALAIPFALFFSGAPEVVDSNDPTVVVDDMIKVTIDIEVSIGRKKKNCGGFGICGKVTVGGFDKPLRGNKAYATVTMDKKSGEATHILFHRKHMSSEVLKKYFSGKHFTVEEDFKDSLVKKDQKFILMIGEGKYKFKKTKKGFLMPLNKK